MTVRDAAIMEAIKTGTLLRDVAIKFDISESAVVSVLSRNTDKEWRKAWHEERGIALDNSSKKLPDDYAAYIIRWRLNGNSIEAIATALSRSVLGIISAWQNYATDEQKLTLNERVTKSIIWTDERRDRLQELMNEGYKYTYIADLLELSVSAIKRYLYYRNRRETIQALVSQHMDDSPSIPVESAVDDDIPVNGLSIGGHELIEYDEPITEEPDKSEIKEHWTELDIEKLLIETGLNYDYIDVFMVYRDDPEHNDITKVVVQGNTTAMGADHKLSIRERLLKSSITVKFIQPKMQRSQSKPQPMSLATHYIANEVATHLTRIQDLEDKVSNIEDMII